MSIPILPPSAPFTSDQRAWLNGFLAGIFGNEINNHEVQALPHVLAEASEAPVEDEDFPWHDAALPLDERMQLAAGKPIKLQMMAAMAQLDCGTCGYLCQTYAQAIAEGAERDLTKCTPGGKETNRKLKELVASEKS